MSKRDDALSLTHFPKGSSEFNDLERRKVFVIACRTLVDKFVNISYSNFSSGSDSCICIGLNRVNAFASHLLSLGLLLIEFNNGIRQSDGDQSFVAAIMFC